MIGVKHLSGIPGCPWCGKTMSVIGAKELRPGLWMLEGACREKRCGFALMRWTGEYSSLDSIRETVKEAASGD